VVYLPKMLLQSVDLRKVAEALAHLAIAPR
jgi:hypothetical protein